MNFNIKVICGILLLNKMEDIIRIKHLACLKFRQSLELKLEHQYFIFSILTISQSSGVLIYFCLLNIKKEEVFSQSF